ncbi:MAG TPA: class I SAM-dependent methyltransferase [Conexibacter sp.]|nr:class I SAM-dependent methyltransferase [Conexibacter sp.]
MRALYDQIGSGYALRRNPDPTIAAAIDAALGDARSVLNVGAGTGSYEPVNREVVAIEPSAVMIAQRATHVAPAIQASADALPFADDSFDAAMAIFSDHHWPDREAGFRELRRVARRRVVIVNADPGEAERFWLTTNYLPGFLRLIPARYRTPGAWEADATRTLGQVRRMPLPIPHDCTDGFYGAYWRRPERYLDPAARAAISVFSRLGHDEVADAMTRLHDDLDSGRWHDRHANLLDRPDLDLGYAILVAEAGAGATNRSDLPGGERLTS